MITDFTPHSWRRDDSNRMSTRPTVATRRFHRWRLSVNAGQSQAVGNIGAGRLRRGRTRVHWIRTAVIFRVPVFGSLVTFDDLPLFFGGGVIRF